MKNLVVITGGGSGMGLELAKLVDKDNKIILVGRSVEKLQDAIKELETLGLEAEGFPGDVSDRESIKELVKHCLDQGNIKALVHAAGVSPHMTDGKTIFDINAAGTVNINEEFASNMKENSVILNVASMSAYMVPEDRVPVDLYKLALDSVEAFEKGAEQMLSMMPEEQKSGGAYSISKNFVKWYTEKMAIKYGPKGIRVVSISPGTIATPMGELEGEQAASFAINGPLQRVGKPEEIAKMMKFMISDDASYLTGTDILYDGGSVAAFKNR